MMGRLTRKRRVFIEEYLQCWNGAEAARRAGYKFPRRQASYLLTIPDIQAEIERRIDEKTMTADEVLLRLADQARADIGPFVSKNDDGELRLDWEKLKEAGLTHLVKSLIPTRYGTKIELHDAQAALVHLARSHALFKDRIDVTSDDQPIRVIGADLDKL
jgi:hypothetical protein